VPKKISNNSYTLIVSSLKKFMIIKNFIGLNLEEVILKESKHHPLAKIKCI